MDLGFRFQVQFAYEIQAMPKVVCSCGAAFPVSAEEAERLKGKEFRCPTCKADQRKATSPPVKRIGESKTADAEGADDAARLCCKSCGKICLMTRKQRRQSAGQKVPCPHCGQTIVIPRLRPESLWESIKRSQNLPAGEENDSDPDDYAKDDSGDLVDTIRARESQARSAQIMQIFGFIIAITLLAGLLKILDAETFAKVMDTIGDWSVAAVSHWLTWYTIFHAPLAIWVFVDAKRRMSANPEVWGIGTFLLGMAVLPWHYAQRNLRTGEVREGGFGWNVLRGFVLMWTAEVIAVAAYVLVAVALLVGAGVELFGNNHRFMAGPGVARFILALGIPVTFIWLCCTWLVPMVGAAAFGFFLKNSSIVERGPTGALAKQDSADLAIEWNSSRGLGKAIVLACCIFVLVGGIAGVHVFRGRRGAAIDGKLVAPARLKGINGMPDVGGQFGGGNARQEARGPFNKDLVARPQQEVEPGMKLPDVGQPFAQRKVAKVDGDEEKRIIAEYVTQRFRPEWDEVKWWPAAEIEVKLGQPKLRVCRLWFHFQNELGADVLMDRFFVLKNGRVAGVYDKETDVGQACSTRYAELLGTAEERNLVRQAREMAKDFLEGDDPDKRPDQNVPNRERAQAKAVANDKANNAPQRGAILPAKKKGPIDPEVKKLMSRLDSAQLAVAKIAAADTLKAMRAKADPACEALAELMVKDRNPNVRSAASEAIANINPALHKLIVPIVTRDKNPSGESTSSGRGISKCWQALYRIRDLGPDAHAAFPVVLQYVSENPDAPALEALVAVAPDDKQVFAGLAKLVRLSPIQNDYGVLSFRLLVRMRDVDNKQFSKVVTEAVGPKYPADVRLAAMEVLPSLGKDARPAIDFLRNAKGDGDGKVRAAAKAALEAIEH